MGPNKIPAAALLQKYLDGTISEPESEVLFAFIRENSVEGDTNLEEVLQKAYQQAFAAPDELSIEARKRILDKLMITTSAPEIISDPEVSRTVVHTLRRRWWRYVAAAVIAAGIAGGAITWFNQHREKDSLATLMEKAEKIGPGTERAILKLGNGQRLPLDSANGNIMQSGNLIVNNYGGKLDYEGKTDVPEYHTLITPRGGQYKVQLPDGTDVWLNAESAIVYPTAFTGDQRKVKVTGEAYFEVARQAGKPFVVDVDGKAVVEVLGTHFNISAYADEKQIQTTLLEGSVRILHHREMAVLRPGQQAQLANLEINVINNPDLETVMAWRNGVFHFNNARLDEVLRQLARWYDLDIVYEKEIPGIVFKGDLKKDLNLSQALIILSQLGVHFNIEGKKLIVVP